jgi:hypothetical protein
MTEKITGMPVVYACDVFGDHQAEPHRLTDVDSKEFKDLDKALKFANECSECLNIEDLLYQAGVSARSIKRMEIVTLGTEELLLDQDNFIPLRDRSIIY